MTEAIRAAYMALPAPAVKRDPWEILSVRPGNPPTPMSYKLAEAAYRAMAKELHPDAGGEDATKMAELNGAIDEIRAQASAEESRG